MVHSPCRSARSRHEWLPGMHGSSRAWQLITHAGLPLLGNISLGGSDHCAEFFNVALRMFCSCLMNNYPYLLRLYTLSDSIASMNILRPFAY